MRYALFILFVVSCSTSSRRDLPSEEVRNRLKSISARELAAELPKLENESRYSEFQAEYILAMHEIKAQDKNGCTRLLKLHQEMDFWSKDLTAIRLYEMCDRPLTETERQDIFTKKSVTIAYWRAHNRKAVATGRKADEVDAHIELAKRLVREEEKKERREHAEQAAELVRKLNDPEREKKALDILYQVSPRRKPNPTKQEYLSVAWDFREAMQYAKARHFYKVLSQDKTMPWKTRARAMRGIWECFKNESKTPEHLSAMQAEVNFLASLIARHPKDSEIKAAHIQAIEAFSKAYWTEGMVVEARNTLLKAVDLYSGKMNIDIIYRVLGRIDEEQGNPSQALRYYDQALLENGTKPEVKENLLWLKAWLQRKLQSYPDAADTLKVLIETPGIEMTKTKYLFWLAKTQQDLGSDQANMTFQKTIDNDMFSYYSLLAHKELSKPISLETLKIQKTTSEETSRRNLDLARAKATDPENLRYYWWVDVNEHALARTWILERIELRPSEIESRLYDLSLVGLYPRIYTYLGTMPLERRVKFIQDHIDTFFPRSYLSEFESAASRFKMHVEWILSLARQESAFDPYAKSPRDAMGLMQVMPDAALTHAAENGIPYKEPDDLYKPEINVPIGTSILVKQKNKFKGAFIPTVASYNARESALNGWIRSRYTGDVLAFIEDVPYEETKAYIKLTMRNYIFYSLLDSPTGSIVFPSELLVVVKE